MNSRLSSPGAWVTKTGRFSPLATRVVVMATMSPAAAGCVAVPTAASRDEQAIADAITLVELMGVIPFPSRLEGPGSRGVTGVGARACGAASPGRSLAGAANAGCSRGGKDLLLDPVLAK